LLTYQLQPRSLVLRRGPVPTFPRKATITVQCRPGHVFGGSRGPLSAIVIGSDALFDFDANVGRTLTIAKPPLRPLAAALPTSGGRVAVRKNRFSYRFTCQSAGHLATVMGTLHLTVPSIIGLGLTDPVTSYATTAIVGKASFAWQYRAAVQPLVVATPESIEANLAKALGHFDRLLESDSRRVLAAAHYVQVAGRLQEVGTSKWEYMAEVVLNYSKALGSLFGSRRDAVRRHLGALGYSEATVEGVFVPLLLLRNSLDVAHARLTGFKSGDLDGIYSYLDDVNKPMRDLIWRVLDSVAAKRYTLRPIRNRVLSATERRAIQRVVAKAKAANAAGAA